MSTIPLSARDLDSGEGPSTDTTHVESPATWAKESNDKIDRVIESAMAKIPSAVDDEPVRSKKSLDESISEGLDKHYEAADDREAWSRSKDARSEMDSRYSSQGGTTEKTLDLFLDMLDQLDRDPQGTAQHIAANYLKASRYALDNKPAKAKSESFVDGWGNRHSGKYLDHVIEDAIDNSTADRESFEATEKQRARLKARWPSLSFDQAMDRIRTADRRLHEDPLTASAELGAMAGMPVLPHQHQQQAVRDHAQGTIASAIHHLPGLAQKETRAAVADILQHPSFRSSGDMGTDLARAYQVNDVLQRQNAQIANWAGAELGRMDPQHAKAVVNTILHNADFKAQAGRNVDSRPFGDPAVALENFRLAHGMVLAKATSAGAVSKAKKAGKIHSSSGALPGGGKTSGLDGAINAALAGWRD